jgi:hypothetical protein
MEQRKSTENGQVALEWQRRRGSVNVRQLGSREGMEKWVKEWGSRRRGRAHTQRDTPKRKREGGEGEKKKSTQISRFLLSLSGRPWVARCRGAYGSSLRSPDPKFGRHTLEMSTEVGRRPVDNVKMGLRTFHLLSNSPELHADCVCQCSATQQATLSAPCTCCT